MAEQDREQQRQDYLKRIPKVGDFLKQGKSKETAELEIRLAFYDEEELLLSAIRNNLDGIPEDERGETWEDLEEHFSYEVESFGTEFLQFFAGNYHYNYTKRKRQFAKWFREREEE